MNRNGMFALSSLLIVGLFVLQVHAASLWPPQTKTVESSLDAAPDPVSASDGSFYFNMSLLELGGPMNLGFRLRYHSDQPRSNWDLSDLPSWGKWWWDPKATCIRMSMGGHEVLQFQIERANPVAFAQYPGEDWRLVDEADYGMPSSSVAFQLVETNDWVYLFDPRKGRTTMFDLTNGMYRIRAVVDRNRNTLQYRYDPDTHHELQPLRIEDDFGRFIDLTYTNLPPFDGYIESVTDHAGRRVLFRYEKSSNEPFANEVLREVVDVTGGTNRFDYTDIVVTQTWGNVIYADLMTAHRLPAGNTPWTQDYDVLRIYDSDEDDKPAVIRQTDAYGNVLTFQYDTNTSAVAVAWPNGGTNVFRHGGRGDPPQAVIDPDGGMIGFDVNEHNQMVTLSNRLGGATSFTYDPLTRELTSITNALGREWSADYVMATQTVVNPFNAESVEFTVARLSRAVYADDTEAFIYYDVAGNVTARVDRAGAVWTYAYNGQGQKIRVGSPDGGETLYTYHADGTLATETDSVTGITSYSYDSYKRIHRIDHPDGSFALLVYDLAGRVTSLTDENGNETVFTYDPNGNLVRLTNPEGDETLFEHDLLNRVIAATDELGNRTTLAYDSMGRLERVTDPASNETATAYSPQGWPIVVTDGEGGEWSLVYNAEGVPVSRITPLGRTTTWKRDALGHVCERVDPLNHTNAFVRDDRFRMSTHTDPLGRQTHYEYDGQGRLTGVTLPDGTGTTYARNGLGQIEEITDLGGHGWLMEHDGTGRLVKTTDPLGNEWRYSYDNRARLEQITYPDASTQTRTYDAVGNLLRRQYSAGPDLSFTYDSLNRTASAQDIEFSYDAAGRLTNTVASGVSFGATYDAAGRLTAATYADGFFTVTYSYDARYLLTHVTDDLTNTEMRFFYNADGQLTNVTRSSGGDTTYTYDAASRLTRIRHDTTADLQYTFNAAGEITQLMYDLPLDPAAALTSSTLLHTFDSASQIASVGYAHDALGRLTHRAGQALQWDGAGRLVSAGPVLLGYNGMNDLVIRSEGGVTNRFHYNYALNKYPIVAEKNEAEAGWNRFYVLSPAGRLLYLIEAAAGNAVRFFHFDHLGNTLFLTDEAGAVMDRYAYSPYGRLLAHEGGSDQPFTFGGQWQVRREGDADLYHMRARYYDATTARFLSREPLWPLIETPVTLNPYPFAAQNPLRYTDPDGLLVYSGDDWDDVARVSFSYLFLAKHGTINGEVRDNMGEGMLDRWNEMGIDDRMKVLDNIQRAHLLEVRALGGIKPDDPERAKAFLNEMHRRQMDRIRNGRPHDVEPAKPELPENPPPNTEEVPGSLLTEAIGEAIGQIEAKKKVEKKEERASIEDPPDWYKDAQLTPFSMFPAYR